MTHALPTRRSSGRADVRDGACSSSTLQEAASWGKVSTAMEQMVFAEAGSVIPLLASDAYHRGHWKTRAKRAYATMFDRSEEHTSELQSLMRISYAVFCLKKKRTNNTRRRTEQQGKTYINSK